MGFRHLLPELSVVQCRDHLLLPPVLPGGELRHLHHRDWAVECVLFLHYQGLLPQHLCRF